MGTLSNILITPGKRQRKSSKKILGTTILVTTWKSRSGNGYLTNTLTIWWPRKKENYRKLLDEQKGIALDSNFKDIKKLIRDDPRYSRYSSSERKCEKQFNEYIKDRIAQAKAAFRQLLVETKFVTDKSLALVRDKDSGHLPEIEELLKKDKRYLDMDVIPEDRKSILFTYMEELEKRGPPPPPTASEPTRRGAP